MSFLADLYEVLKTGGLQLDKAEAQALGGPKGDTISVWAAMESRHGSALAHVACAAFSVLIQTHHCRDQIAGVPMETQNYVRALVGLVLFAPVAGVVWLAEKL